MTQVKIAIIGGSGLDDIVGFSDRHDIKVTTPFGDPSDTVTIGKVGDITVAFLPRHGKNHHLLPSEVPGKANIYALKALGVEHIVAVNSVGSLNEEIKPGDLVIPDQLIDRTKCRVDTFFGNGVVAHILFSDPFCPVLSQVACNSAKTVGATVHMNRTCVVIEGPALSTRAESRLYRSWGADIINMTTLPEAKLSREAEICYTTIACVTDNDCQPFKENRMETIINIQTQNSQVLRKVLSLVVAKIPEKRPCNCATALREAIETPQNLIPSCKRKELGLLINKYLDKER
jgi:5'-methylthioadenosine phosphorylase